MLLSPWSFQKLALAERLTDYFLHEHFELPGSLSVAAAGRPLTHAVHPEPVWMAMHGLASSPGTPSHHIALPATLTIACCVSQARLQLLLP